MPQSLCGPLRNWSGSGARVDGRVVVGRQVRDVLVDERRRSGPRRDRARGRTARIRSFASASIARVVLEPRRAQVRRPIGPDVRRVPAVRGAVEAGAGGDTGFAEAAHREHLAQVGRRGDVLGRRHPARHEVHAAQPGDLRWRSPLLLPVVGLAEQLERHVVHAGDRGRGRSPWPVTTRNPDSRAAASIAAATSCAWPAQVDDRDVGAVALRPRSTTRSLTRPAPRGARRARRGSAGTPR